MRAGRAVSLAVGLFCLLGGCGSDPEPASTTIIERPTKIETVVETQTVEHTTPTQTADTASPEEALNAAIATVNEEGYEPADTDHYDADATLRVIVGIRKGSVDGNDQRAFFFAGSEYLGTDTSDRSGSIHVEFANDTTLALSYALFAPDDPLCCPSSRKTVRYRWDGQQLNPLDAIPPRASATRTGR
jgi:hypothetical protein